MQQLDKVKKYLNQIGMYTIKIKTIKEEIGLIQIEMGSIKGTDYNKIGFNSNFNTVSPQEILINRLVGYEKELEQLQKDYIEIRKDIIKKIFMINDISMFKVLHERYVKLKGWKKIEKELDYTERQLHRVHKKALENLEKILNL